MMRPPLSVVALGAASGLLAAAVVAWLLPVSLGSSALLVIGHETVAGLLPVLHGQRYLLAALAGVGAVLGVVSWWGVPPVPGAGLLVGLGVTVEVAVLVAVVPVAAVVLGLLTLNFAVWVLLVRVVLVVLRMVAS